MKLMFRQHRQTMLNKHLLNGLCAHWVNIVACQRGGVSNKPSWAQGSDKTQGQGSVGPFTGGHMTSLAIITQKFFLKRNGPYILTHFY